MQTRIDSRVYVEFTSPTIVLKKKPKIGPKSPNSKKEIEKPLNPFSIVYEDTNSELETL
jgi:hypothetical protein